MADQVIKSGKHVVCDFICPTKDTRTLFKPDYAIYVDCKDIRKNYQNKYPNFKNTLDIFEEPSYGETLTHNIIVWPEVSRDDPAIYQSNLRTILERMLCSPPPKLREQE